MLNVAILMGRLVADPELKHTQNDTAVCSFRIAVERNFADRDGNRQADFLDIVAWRQTAEFVCKYFTKGQMIALRGSIQARNYEDKNGNKRTAVEVVADQVNFCGGDAPAGTRTGQPSAGTAGGTIPNGVQQGAYPAGGPFPGAAQQGPFAGLPPASANWGSPGGSPAAPAHSTGQGYTQYSQQAFGTLPDMQGFDSDKDLPF